VIFTIGGVEKQGVIIEVGVTTGDIPEISTRVQGDNEDYEELLGTDQFRLI
jgi:hypothetical protein